MVTLYWIFKNGHVWSCDRENESTARMHAECLGLFSDPNVAKAWIQPSDSTMPDIMLIERGTQ